MKRFLFIVTLNLVIYFISATPTEITPFKVMQPNGDSITIIQHGDEYGT
jgi:hypothetical protein